MHPYEGKYLYGELSYNPNNEFVENHVMKCDYVADYEIISMEEAYSKITKGEFGLKHENIKRVEERLNIEITGCKLVYEADSKGYLQPNYDFYCIINGSVDEIFIPALKK